MRCMMCENLSPTHICTHCQDTLLKPSLYKRRLDNGITVLSFYKYDEIKELIHTKHTDLGFHIYTILAKKTFALFGDTFVFEADEKVVSIAIDDTIKSGYSHTALLNKQLKKRYIKPIYNKLRARNNISYSGKSREFRLNNLRDFQLKHFKEKSVILVDDIVTTGATLSQAIELLQIEGKEVLLCLTLCDVNNK